jgi:hypothetical protein
MDTSTLRGGVNAPGINQHQAALETIANENFFNGVPTRATGTNGHKASVVYVTNVMKAAGWTVTEQPFTADIFYEEGPAAFERTGPPPAEA